MPHTQPLAIPSVNPGANSDEIKQWNRVQNLSHVAFNELARAISAATTGKKRKVAIREFLRSPKVRMSAALRALPENSERHVATKLRNQVNAWSTVYEPVPWHNKKKNKNDGSVRQVCDLPLELKAVHYMIAKVIGELFERSDTIYGVPGFSRDDAARELKALQSDGYVHLAHTDIVDCFPSIASDTLYSLPLPKEVISQTLDIRNLKFKQIENQSGPSDSGPFFTTHRVQHSASGPTGLMQGSPASNIILAWLLNDIPNTDDTKVMLCFDNIVVASRTEAGSREMVDTLAAHFERCPSGPLTLCPVEFANNTPMKFLGYSFDPSQVDIGTAMKDGTRKSLEVRLIEEEVKDVSLIVRLQSEHRNAAREKGVSQNKSPLLFPYPIGVWRALLDIRAGYSAASPRGSELMYYLETSMSVIDMRQDWFTTDLHLNLFAPSHSRKGKNIRRIMRKFSKK